MNKESKLCPDFYYIYSKDKLIDFKYIKNDNKETSGKEKAKIYK